MGKKREECSSVAIVWNEDSVMMGVKVTGKL